MLFKSSTYRNRRSHFMMFWCNLTTSQIIFWEGFLLHGLWAKTGWSMEKVLMSTNFIKAIDQTFYGFTSVITHLGCWKRTQEKLVNHEPKGSWFTKLSFEWSYHRIFSTDSKVSSLTKLHQSSILAVKVLISSLIPSVVQT